MLHGPRMLHPLSTLHPLARCATLSELFVLLHGPPASRNHRRATLNFCRSVAAWAVACYLLQIKDRHNGNIMLHAMGHVVHIDFGFLLSCSPGGNMNFESAPFKLTSECAAPHTMGSTTHHGQHHAPCIHHTPCMRHACAMHVYHTRNAPYLLYTY